MFGAMLPRAAAGLRPICVQVCASECTKVWDCMERTMAKSLFCQLFHVNQGGSNNDSLWKTRLRSSK